ncbi:MAG: response regulator [Proteobacteria bacterium]|nr:response regulator [Pseudomonadota bacterium]
MEDDPFIAMDIEAAVIDHLGDQTEILLADSLRTASSLADDQVHMALLDVDVIGGKTFEIALSLHRRGTPFAFVSGSLPADLPHELHGAAFVRKPFHARDILSFVKSALNRSSNDNEDQPAADN